MTTIRDEALGNYFIEIDETQHTLKQDTVITNKESGEKSEGDSVIGYYVTLEACVHKIVKMKMLEGADTRTLKEYVQAFRTEREALTKAVA